MTTPQIPHEQPTQSGKRAGLNILLFVVGFILFLVLLKYVMG